MSNPSRAHARSQLDLRMRHLPPLEDVAVPHRGWIRALREALGMSRRDVARRMGVSPQTVPDLERSEARETIKIDSLRRAAEALDCDLVYYLRPRRKLEDTVEAQARRKAASHLRGVSHHSLLEDQAVTWDAASGELEDLVGEFIDRRGLWVEDGAPS